MLKNNLHKMVQQFMLSSQQKKRTKQLMKIREQNNKYDQEQYLERERQDQLIREQLQQEKKQQSFNQHLQFISIYRVFNQNQVQQQILEFYHQQKFDQFNLFHLYHQNGLSEYFLFIFQYYYYDCSIIQKLLQIIIHQIKQCDVCEQFLLSDTLLICIKQLLQNNNILNKYIIKFLLYIRNTQFVLHILNQSLFEFLKQQIFNFNKKFLLKIFNKYISEYQDYVQFNQNEIEYLLKPDKALLKQQLDLAMYLLVTNQDNNLLSFKLIKNNLNKVNQKQLQIIKVLLLMRNYQVVEYLIAKYRLNKLINVIQTTNNFSNIILCLDIFNLIVYELIQRQYSLESLQQYFTSQIIEIIIKECHQNYTEIIINNNQQNILDFIQALNMIFNNQLAQETQTNINTITLKLYNNSNINHQLTLIIKQQLKLNKLKRIVIFI